jgi:hypothetical protein
MMGAGYEYSLDREAVAVLLQCSRKERRVLAEIFERMARYPFFIGDLQLAGSDGRVCQVIDVGDFVVTCWSDHAVKMVRVLSIERI